MCAVSMVMDHYKDKWDPILPGPFPQYPGPNPQFPPQSVPFPGTPIDDFTKIKVNLADRITREEFDALRKDVLEMKELVKRALKYDEDTGQKDCENQQKIDLIRAVAEAVGINVDDVFGAKHA